MAVKLGLLSFHKDSSHMDLPVKSDNSTMVAYLNRMGGTKSVACDRVARDIWTFCDIWLVATRIPGE